MLTLIINLAVLAFLFAAAAKIILISLHADSGQPHQLSSWQFIILVLGLAPLLIKFILLGDAVLIIGQAVLIPAALIYGWRTFFAPPTIAGKPKPAASGQQSVTFPDAAMATGQNPSLHRPKRKPRGMRRKLAIAGGILLLMVVIVGIWIIRSFNTSSQGTLDKPQDALANAPAPKTVSFSGKRFSFNYTNYFTQSHTDPPSQPILENYIFVKHQLLDWQLAIQIESLPSGNLNDDGSYHFRSVTHDRFTDNPTTINGVMVHVFTDKSSGFNFAKVLYLQHQGLLAIISLGGGSSSDGDAMQAALLGIANSWQWVQ
ncbi:MAG TPA: hypothetical protein VLG13_03750 [Patescibacteria group bacterium]|nr:hypothetical protein [Patescibacteria group bacterium]